MRLLATCMLFAVASSAQTAEITVRLVYVKNGKPAGVHEFILYEGKPSSPSTRSIRARTDKLGVARVTLSEPLPSELFLYEEDGQIEGCAKEDRQPLNRVLTAGVTIGRDKVTGLRCKGDESTIDRNSAKPGEIVMFVRKLTAWDNFIRY